MKLTSTRLLLLALKLLHCMCVHHNIHQQTNIFDYLVESILVKLWTLWLEIKDIPLFTTTPFDSFIHEKLSEVIDQQSHARVRGWSAQETAETINSRINWRSFLQIIIIITVAVGQVRTACYVLPLSPYTQYTTSYSILDNMPRSIYRYYWVTLLFTLCISRLFSFGPSSKTPTSAHIHMPFWWCLWVCRSSSWCFQCSTTCS